MPNVDSAAPASSLPTEVSLEPSPGSQGKRLLIFTSGLEKGCEMPAVKQSLPPPSCVWRETAQCTHYNEMNLDTFLPGHRILGWGFWEL